MYMPAVKFFERLDFEEKFSFLEKTLNGRML